MQALKNLIQYPYLLFPKNIFMPAPKNPVDDDQAASISEEKQDIQEEAPQVVPPKVPVFKNPPAFVRGDALKGGKYGNLNQNMKRPGRAAARGR